MRYIAAYVIGFLSIAIPLCAFFTWKDHRHDKEATMPNEYDFCHIILDEAGRPHCLGAIEEWMPPDPPQETEG